MAKRTKADLADVSGGLATQSPTATPTDVPALSKLIYFVTADHPGFPVKIGSSTTATIRGRFRALQTALPYPLVVLLVITDDGELERLAHDCFPHLRLSGEWFTRCPEIYDTIYELEKLEPAWRQHSPIPVGKRPSSTVRATAAA